MPLVFDFVTIKDLPPDKDPKGGARGSPTQPQPEKKPKSDQLRSATFGDYIKAQSHSETGSQHGWRGFLRSSLFAALVIFFLGQFVTIGGAYFLNYVRTQKLWEWKVTTDLTLKRMDDWGTIHGHYADERQDASIIELQSRAKNQADIASQIAQLSALQSERNNQQDKDIAELKAQMSQYVVIAQRIETKLAVVADLLDERTKKR